jgi:DNA-directed RNA polymerase subunit N (RpoN/RPB10)
MVLANKWNYYVKRCKEIEEEQKTKEGESSEVKSMFFDKNFKMKIFEELELERYCCKRHLLGHVELIDII